MINVEFNFNSLKATGHAAKKGKVATENEKLVCNSVSTIMWGLVNALEHEGIEPVVEFSSGYQMVSYTGNKNARRLFNAYANNLRSLSEDFPEYINFEIKS